MRTEDLRRDLDIPRLSSGTIEIWASHRDGRRRRISGSCPRSAASTVACPYYRLSSISDDYRNWQCLPARALSVPALGESTAVFQISLLLRKMLQSIPDGRHDLWHGCFGEAKSQLQFRCLTRF
jgi:hypothetical protein